MIQSEESFVLAGRAVESFPLCIESSSGEVVMRIDPPDLICVSAPEGGDAEAAMTLLELVRVHHVPLVVLDKGHAGSRRIRYVVSAGPVIRLACGIARGTHPEQEILCAGTDLDGLILGADADGFILRSVPSKISFSRIAWTGSLSEGVIPARFMHCI
jgi:hypothetical protein